MNTTLEARVAALFVTRGLSLATAESCTGGLIGHRLTNLSGSSAFYRGGVVAYHNTVKQQLLGVQSATLAVYGAVSEAVAGEMARGVRVALCADIGIGVTGIAGPTGGSTDKPVGLVYIGLADASQCIVQRFVFSGDRHNVKAAASDAALTLLTEKFGG